MYSVVCTETHRFGRSGQGMIACIGNCRFGSVFPP
jgi:hypothetical protein